MASYKEKNFIADEKPQSKRPGKRNEPEHEYLDTLGSAKERVADWRDRGLPRDAAYSKVAIDEIIKEIKNTDDPKRLEELGDAMRDVQMNKENSKWIKDRKRDYYGREPDPDEYIPNEEGAEKKDPFDLDPKEEGVSEKITEVDIDDTIPETDELADFQKSLDDYAAKNKKGREDIPVGYRR